MKRILVIDDMPERAIELLRNGHFVAIAHTRAQIEFWLKHGPWDHIIMDHDLERRYDGTDICMSLGDDIVSFGCPISIWSHNPDGAARMRRILEGKATAMGIAVNIIVKPFNAITYSAI